LSPAPLNHHNHGLNVFPTLNTPSPLLFSPLLAARAATLSGALVVVLYVLFVGSTSNCIVEFPSLYVLFAVPFVR
jgi:hypothetical protein